MKSFILVFDFHFSFSYVNPRNPEGAFYIFQSFAYNPILMADQHSGEGSSTCNAPIDSSDSTVELNIKTLDSQIYSFRVDKNVSKKK